MNVFSRNIGAAIFSALISISCFAQPNGNNQAVKDSDRIIDALEVYFEAARQFDQVKLISVLSRDRLEFSIRPVIVAQGNVLILESVALMFQFEAVNAVYCRMFLDDFKKVKRGFLVNVLASTIEMDHQAERLDVSLVEEQGRLRLDSIVSDGAKRFDVDDRVADIEICHIPIANTNPVYGVQ